MRAPHRFEIVAIVASVLCLPAVAAGTDLRDSLSPQNIAGVRINLNPWGASLGFEVELAGTDPGVEALLEVMREAEPGAGHKCANAGAIRFRMGDGRVIGVGLLPGHAPGRYDLRLYDGDVFVAVYSVERAGLLDALEALGVPLDDPAFRE